MSLRISGGEMRGRRLYVPRTGVRPTTGRVREAIFSMLGDLSGARVLDIPCGSGALGIEALSRGAEEAVFVDRRPGAALRNVEELDLGDRGWVIKSSIFEFGFRLSDFPNGFNLVLCDPPYRLARGVDSDLDTVIGMALAKGGRVVLETSSQKPLELSLHLAKERRYGDSLVRFYDAPQR